ncbi:MAG: 50S ribosomal protein L22 [Phycisphaeraceae bacterium]|nr:50S ribosomal protein L22 [Phycisphaerales bacterium]MCB9860279.1 50S ribosomal protein L22 [Phycisphaeraceae bacterium]
MRLRNETLKSMLKTQGLGADALATALQANGMSEKGAKSAANNWLMGRNHPRCKSADIVAMANVVGCEPKDIIRFTSEVRFHRGSPLKANLVAGLVRGKRIDEAENLLAFSPQRASVNVLKALKAAVDSAQRAGANESRLFVTECRIDQGPHIKRFQPKDRGRAHPILKRTSHITVSVEEKN